VYASLSVFQNQLSGVADSDRWVAQYAYQEDDPKAITDYQSSPWNEDAYSCLIRQYTSCGQIAGYSRDLDLDKFYGSRSDWQRLTNSIGFYRDGVNYSAVYNYTYYVDNYSDLYAIYGVNNDKYGALTHFITFGMSEQRQASASFNVKSYRLQYRDLRVAFGDNWKAYYLHYIECGQREGRAGTGCTTLQGAVTTYDGVNYSAVYDYTYYYSHNVDLQRAFGPYDDDALLRHFITFGMSEQRQASASFNVKSYRLQYRDLRVAFGDNWKAYYLHYIECGQREGRAGTGCTTLQGAVTTYDGVNYSAVYDYTYYYSHNVDLQRAFGPYDDDALLRHFITFGMSEQRQASASFNVKVYKAYNPDLQKAFGDNWKAYYLHFVTRGQYESRKCV
jgi:hypothetical protein